MSCPACAASCWLCMKQDADRWAFGPIQQGSSDVHMTNKACLWNIAERRPLPEPLKCSLLNSPALLMWFEGRAQDESC